MMKRFGLFAVVMLLVAAFVAPAAAQDEFVFGMILVGPKNDRGWSQAHYEGGLAVEESIPGAKMLVFESLNPADTPEATLESVVTDMVAQGAQLIITSSDSFEKDTDAVAANFPEVTFVNISGSNALETKASDVYAGLVEASEAEAVPANVSNIMAAVEWDKLIAGCAAAMTSETGSIAYLGPLINAETRRLAASAYLGAKYCWENYAGNEPGSLTFTVTWIGFWFNIPGVTLDPTEEVNSFFDNGADVVISGIDTTEAVVVAGQRAEAGERVFSVAYDNKDGCAEGVASCLGVPYYNWGVLYSDLVTKVAAGTWEQSWIWAGPNWEDLNGATSPVGFLPSDVLSEEATVALSSFVDEMVTFALENPDSLFLWEGPLALQSGYELAAEGELVDALEVWYLPELLDGMTGASN